MQLPLDTPRILRLAQRHGTPLWVYDAAIIRERIASLKAFDTIRYAQKACSNLHILRLMRAEGVLVDAVSPGEIERALRAGYSAQGEEAGIVFTADVITESTIAQVIEHRIPVNAGSIDMLEQLGERAPGHPVWLRINPGFGHGHHNKVNTGGEHSKHGIWHTDLPQAIAMIRTYHLDLVGLHMHIGSGVDYHHLEQVCFAMVGLVKAAGHDLRAISTGGGLTVNYHETDPVVDTDHYFGLWDAARQDIAARLGHPVRLEIEPGRYLMAESGLLISEVRATKAMGRNHFVLVDAGFNELMRPSMYGSLPRHQRGFRRWREPPSEEDHRRGSPLRIGGCLHPEGRGHLGPEDAARGEGRRPGGVPRHRRLRCRDVLQLQQPPPRRRGSPGRRRRSA